jgi:hypothetical protein
MHTTEGDIYIERGREMSGATVNPCPPTVQHSGPVSINFRPNRNDSYGDPFSIQ